MMSPGGAQSSWMPFPVGEVVPRAVFAGLWEVQLFAEFIVAEPGPAPMRLV